MDILSILLIVGILFSHFVADFACQSDKMKKDKSANNDVLLSHVLVYTAVLFVLTFVSMFAVTAVAWDYLLYWAVLNGALHFIVDYFTSRATTKLWAKGDTHNFFLVIGFDQFLHSTTLIGTFIWLF